MARGHRSERSRPRAATMLHGNWPAPTVTRYGVPTTMAIIFRTSVGVVSGASWSLESLETVFNQDLNGDGVVGLNPHVIQTDTSSLGSTSLAAIGNNYFLYAAGGTTGPELQYNGSAGNERRRMALGHRSERSRPRAATMLHGKWPAPTGTRCGVPTTMAIIFRTSLALVSGASWSLESLEPDLQPGPQRRWGGGAQFARHPDGHELTRLDQPGCDWQQLFFVCGGRHNWA